MVPVRATSEDTETPAELGTQAIEAQAQALHTLALSLNGSFDKAVQAILDNCGYLVISGMGKSGLVGRKMAATFSSIGSPSFFIHPSEAIHGDLGMIRPDSLIILISNSGETAETLSLIPSLRRMDNRIIAMVGRADSTLGKSADIVLTLPIQREICPHNLVPTTSTLVTMALGDALAVALMRKRGFQPKDFALNHPGGYIGRRLLSKVKDRMHKRTEGDFPIITPTATMQETIWAMTHGRMGLALVMEDELLTGIITDGDLRRAMINASFSMTDSAAIDIMHWDPVTISQEAPWSEAEQIMSEKKIKALVALDDEQVVAGVVEIF